MTNHLSPYRCIPPCELKLKKFYPHRGESSFEVTACFKIKRDFIWVIFQVTKKNNISWHTPHHGKKHYYENWGLWEYDVVEFFLQGRDHKKDFSSPYIEFLLSPHGESFALKTHEPRKIIETPLNLDFRGTCELNDNKWLAEMKIKNPFSHHYLYGNFHACLEKGSRREYWSSFYIPSEKPDFHRPREFAQLGEKI